ncbi:hypothetical protein M153_5050002994 [Pseudoloma neurophilia]|uniref:Uncharacterized protein n=1 Tax=Pseudoloma neurophilia TaxID=146866 RepID=A0A0R0M337_9MICR|nr:hypothetical protein M153_5050002994 [Pseudoloma neurophilia]
MMFYLLTATIFFSTAVSTNTQFEKKYTLNKATISVNELPTTFVRQYEKITEKNWNTCQTKSTRHIYTTYESFNIFSRKMLIKVSEKKQTKKNDDDWITESTYEDEWTENCTENISAYKKFSTNVHNLVISSNPNMPSSIIRLKKPVESNPLCSPSLSNIDYSI